jgi:hypothetical protein
MPIVYQDAIKGEKRLGTDVPSSRSAVLTEQFAQTFEENPIKAFSRWNALKEDERTGLALDATSARQKLKDAGLDNHLKVNDAGITQAALDTLMERKRTELRRQDVFARAQGGAGEFTQRLGLSIATTLADPISMGLNFVPVVGQTRYARWLAGAGSVGGRIGVRAAVGAAEGAAGAAIAEPFIYGMRTQEQADYDMADSLLNVALGGVIGSGLHATVGSVGELISRRMGTAETARAPLSEPTRAAEPLPADIQRTIFQTPEPSPLGLTERAVNSLPPQVRESALRVAVGQAVEGRPIDVEPLVRAGTPVVEVPRVEVQGLAADQLSRSRDLADRIGVTADIERLAYEGRTATEIVTSLGPRLDRVRELARINGDSPISAASQFVREARTTMGIPSLEERADYLAWRQQYEARQKPLISARTAPRSASSSAPAAIPEMDLAARQADEILSREAAPKAGVSEIEARADAANDEATLAVADAKAAMKRLGQEFDEDAIAENLEKAERWARVAELATVCLVRGD